MLSRGDTFFYFNLGACMLGFKHLKSLYKDEQDFKELYESYQSFPKGDFSIQEGYLFKGNRLWVLRCGTHELILREVHGASLTGHFGEDKTYIMPKEHSFWPYMLKDIQDLIKRCSICQMVKSHVLPQGSTLHCLLHKDHD